MMYWVPLVPDPWVSLAPSARAPASLPVSARGQPEALRSAASDSAACIIMMIASQAWHRRNEA
eukprot:3338483-Rhodomonas_salina.1